MELLLNDCSITYIPKDSKKKKHELKISHQGADALVLAVQSKEQAEQWLKVREGFLTRNFSTHKVLPLPAPLLLETEIQAATFRQMQTTEIPSNLVLQKYRRDVQASKQQLEQPAAQYCTAAAAAAACGFRC